MLNEKLVEFIKADWEANRRAFDAARTSPFTRLVPPQDVRPPEPPQPQPQPQPQPLPLLPQTPSTFPRNR